MMRRWLAGQLSRAADRIYQPTTDDLAEQFTMLVLDDGSTLKLFGKAELPR